MDKNIECSVCLNNEQQLHKLQCGSCNNCILCKDCYETLIENNISFHCPLCNNVIIVKYSVIDKKKLFISVTISIILISIWLYITYNICRSLLLNSYPLRALFVLNIIATMINIKHLTFRKQLKMISMTNLSFIVVNNYHSSNIIFTMVTYPLMILIVYTDLSLIITKYNKIPEIQTLHNITKDNILIRSLNSEWFRELKTFGFSSCLHIISNIFPLITIHSNWKIYFHLKWIKNLLKVLYVAFTANWIRILYLLVYMYINVFSIRLQNGILFLFINTYICDIIHTTPQIMIDLKITNNSFLFLYQAISIYEILLLTFYRLFNIILKEKYLKNISYSDLKYPQLGSLLKL